MSAETSPYAFISYSTQQLDYARTLNDYLNAQGFDTWFDKVQLGAGDQFIEALARATSQCGVLIFISTPDSHQSKWCKREIVYADKFNRSIVELLLEDYDSEAVSKIKFVLSDAQHEDVRDNELPGALFLEKLQTYIPRVSVGQNLVNRPLASPNTPNLKIDFYLNWLSAELTFDRIEEGTIDLSGVTKPHAGPRDLFMLADDDLEMLQALWHSPQKQEIAREDAQPVENVLDALGSFSRVILLGEPGGGKTTTLQRLALRTVEGYRQPTPGKPPLLPVFVKLAEFNNSTPFAEYALKTLGDLRPYVDQLPLVWLLDSFNEMPRTEVDGRQPVNEIRAFLRNPPGAGHGAGAAKFVLSCRVNDYRDELRELPDLDKIELRELSPIQIKAIIDRKLKPDLATALWTDLRGSDALLAAWPYFDGYEADFWQATYHNYFEKVPDAVRRRYIEAAPLSSEERAELLEGLGWWRIPDSYDAHHTARLAIHEDHRKLILICRNPFTLNLVCASVAQGGTAVLPKNRAGLFAGFAELLLKREADLAKKRGQLWPSGTVDRIKAALSAVADALQRTEQRTSLSKADALTAVSQPDAEDLLKKAESANLIQFGDTVRFTHQLLQEYFATTELVKALEQNQSPARFFTWEWWEAGAYRETFVILGEVLRDPNRVARWLAPISPEVALDVILRNGEGLTIKDVTVETQAALIAGAEALTAESDPRGRAAAYRILGLFDADKRAGVGLRPDGLPDIVWCEVPGGEFTMGADSEEYYPVHKVTLETFYIAKYPITYKQFQAFIDAEDGYRNPEWWRSLHPEGLELQKRGLGEQQFKYWNHPRENVSWYEAMAFCCWLTAKLQTSKIPSFSEEVPGMNAVITLPTEEQWETAARGTDGREYPYEGKFDPAKGNTRETGIGQTSAVGIFPEGASPYGVLDMSGNVWEWTLINYLRALRGGSWGYNQRAARAASRFNPHAGPYDRSDPFGFRVGGVIPAG